MGKRFERLDAALKTDRVLTEGQLRRLGGTATELSRFQSVERLVYPIHMRPAVSAEVRFYSRSKALLTRSTSRLEHLAGTAEMRLRLDAPADPSLWKVEHALDGRLGELPDAAWLREGGPVAIEYDKGTYSSQKVLAKLHGFQQSGYSEVVWGVVQERRVDHFRRRYELSPMLLRWWET